MEPIASGYDLFLRYAPAIARFPLDVPLTREMLCCPTFRLHQQGALDMYFVPFEYEHEQARLVLVGITPGWTQMQIAYTVARDGLQAGIEGHLVCEMVDQAASFAGVMRANIGDARHPGPAGIAGHPLHVSALRGCGAAAAHDIAAALLGLCAGSQLCLIVALSLPFFMSR